MARLTDTQLVVLSAASQRDDGSIHPLPTTLKGGAADKVTSSLMRKGLIERIEDDRAAVSDLVRITQAGLEALGIEPDEPDGRAEAATQGPDAKPASKPAGKRKKAGTRAASADTAPKLRDGTKQAALIAMLRRPKGATIGQIAEATGWQRHTIRGAMSGALKKKLGLNVTSEKPDGKDRIYRIIGAA